MSAIAHALVVDDLASSREWLAGALARAFPGVSIARADTVADAMPLLDAAPDLALIDLKLPDGSGVELIERAARRGLATICVVATVFDDDRHLFPALRAGARGYVLKDHSTESLAEMLAGIAGGQPPLSPSIARRLLAHFRPLPAPGPAAEEPALSARESEVLQLVAKGLTVADVASALALSRHTVAGYLKDIYRKLRVSTRAEAALEAARRGLVSTRPGDS